MYRLCGVGREYAIHLRAECFATRGPVGGDPTMGPDAWYPNQLSRFLMELLIAGLLDQIGTEHSGGLPY